MGYKRLDIKGVFSLIIYLGVLFMLCLGVGEWSEKKRGNEFEVLILFCLGIF